MFASLFQTFIAQPIFNLLVAIYALIPGHNFGLAIIVFTIIVRLLMWPLIKKQLHQAKAMRELQPEIKRIKAAAKGNRQQESMMLMELYKERGISPFGSIGTLVVQLIILIALYRGLSKVVGDPKQIVDGAYAWLRSFGWIKELATDINKFDASLLGFIDLKRPALEPGGAIYFPAMALVLGSAVAQYFQSKQLMPQPKEARSLRRILREAGTGKQADTGEVNAAVGRSTRYLLPVMLIMFTVGLPSALSLYWLVGGVFAYWQQAKVLGQDEQEMEKIADTPSGTKVVIDGEVIQDSTTKKQTAKSKKPKTTSKSASKKRRK